MGHATKTKAPEIFPIYLPEWRSKKLIEQYAWAEFEEETRYKHNAVFSYYGTVQENGDVDLSVSYSADDGFCMSAGTCLRKTIKPFSQEELAKLKEQRMFAIAAEEFERREDEKLRRAILKVQRELFGA